MGLLYTKYKMFHFADKLDSLPRENPEIKPPVHIRIKPTNVCNHSCGYCAYRKSNLQLGKDMVVRDMIPKEKMLEIVADCDAMGVRAVTFSGGGEPFCYPHLLQAARALHEAGIRFAALSNGGLLRGEVAEFFARHATWMRISMDGWDGPSYAKFRDVSEKEFDKVLDNIKAFKDYDGPCFLGVSYIVNEDNAAHVYDMIATLHETGADSVKVSPVVISNDGAENNAYHRPFFQSVLEQVHRAQREFADESFEVFNAYHALAERFDKPYTWCPYLQILPVIGADQNVYSCQDKAYNLECGLLGSIRNVRFRDFWMNGKDKFFTIDPSRDCRHHCVAAEKIDTLLEYLRADPDHVPFL